MITSRISLVIIALVVGISTTSPSFAKKNLPAINDEGMELVKDSELATVYADPGADLSIYKRIWLKDATVAFKKNWKRDQNRTYSYRVRDSDMDRIQENVATLFREVFTKELVDGAPKTVREGMTKEEAILARGYPPVHRTYSTEDDRWVYQQNRFVTQTVVFADGKLVAGRDIY